jgi:F-box protein 18 (helicase)
MNFPPSPEQDAARSRATTLQPGQIMTLNAYAGTGKTTTNAFIAGAATPLGWSVLYVCFNKDMAEDARGRFPASVDCRTAHSLAYAAVGRKYRAKLGNVRSYIVSRLLDCSDAEARAALNAVMSYLCSADDALSMEHVVEGIGDRSPYILATACKLWARMCDQADASISMPHDGYLKLWVLSRPKRKHSLILVDEAQDLNPVMLQLVLLWAEAGARVVFVGDTHQSIYAFRLAVDAMQRVNEKATVRLSLTESWRFPQSVADSASKLLKHLKGDDVRLVGRGNGILGAHPNHCTLARTNGFLIQAADLLLETKAGRRAGIHFAATRPETQWNPSDAYRFQEIYDIFALYVGQGSGAVRSPHLKRFSSYQEVLRVAKGESGDGSDGDAELNSTCDLVADLGRDTPSLLRSLEKAAVGPNETPNHFSTVHRAKGKEWDRVTLLEDFLPLDNPAKMAEIKMNLTRREFAETSNLFYVGVTRGRVSFTPPRGAALFFGASYKPVQPFKPGLSKMTTIKHAESRQLLKDLLSQRR